MHALTSNKVSEKTLNERVRKVLELVQLASRAGVPEYAPERKLNRPEDRALLRRAAGESVVLLKNDKNDSTNSPILPLDREKTTLVIGPNADLAAYCGGGSASLLAYYTVTPRQGIADKCGAEQGLLRAQGAAAARGAFEDDRNWAARIYVPGVYGASARVGELQGQRQPDARGRVAHDEQFRVPDGLQPPADFGGYVLCHAGGDI